MTAKSNAREGDGVAEAVAEAIYNALPLTENLTARPPWVPRGNSFKQDEARRYAAAAIAALQAQQGAEPVAWRCVIREDDDGGIATTTKYANTRQDMLIYQDQGYTCTPIPATGGAK